MDYSRDSPDRRGPMIRAPPMMERTGQGVRTPPATIRGASPWQSTPPRYSASPGYGRYSPDYDEGPRRFAGESPPSPYQVPPPPPPPPAFFDESPRRFGGSPAERYPDGPPPPGFQRDHDSPPYRYHSPPSPGYADEGLARFGGIPRAAGRYSPSPRDGALRTFETQSPPHRYTDESPRRFAGGLSPHHYLEGPEGFEGASPQQYLEGASRTPRRSPQRYLEGPPARDSPPGGFIDDGGRRFSGGATPPRLLEDGVTRYPGENTPPRHFDSPDLVARYAQARAAGVADEDEPEPRKFSRSNSPSPQMPAAGGGGFYAEARAPRTPPRSHFDGSSVYGSPTRASVFGGSSVADGGSVYGSPQRDGFATPRGSNWSSSAGSSPPTPPRDARGHSSPPPLAFQAAAAVAAAPAAYSEQFARVPSPPTPRGDGSPPDEFYGPPRTGYRRTWHPSPTRGLREKLRPQAQAPPVANVAHPYLKEEYSFHLPLPRRHATGYTISTPPREDFNYPTRDPAGDDAIYTSELPRICIDEKLKEQTPHQGNPGSATGGGWKDLWAAVIFLLHLGGVAAISVVFGLKALTSTIEEFGTPGAFRIIDWFPQLCAAGIAGAIFSCLWQMAFRIAPVGMIIFTIWSGAFAMSIFGIVLIATGKTTGLIGLVFFFAGLSQCLYAFVVRQRIPFAGDLLRKVISILNRYPSTYLVSYFWVLMGGGWTGLWIFGISGVAKKQYHSFIIVGYVVSLCWTMQVLRNLIRVAVAGTVAHFYVHDHANMPSMPTYIALLRACTISLGSICFGSMIVPLVEVPCHVLRRISAQGSASEFLFSCVACFLHCFEKLIRYFNKWAYIQVAMYGKPFVRASKDTWDMLKAQNVDCMIHDDLIGSIMLISCSVGGSLSAIVGGTWTFVAHKNLTISIAVVSFFIGFLFTYLTLAVYESGVSTYYVMFAEDPDSLQRNDGPLFEKMFVRQMELNPKEYQNPVVLI
ncbi:hypothetical protein MPTK1_1g24820 [Marchantia polymorpha subsp. ruderalis]|uniref:Plasma-membrane choline transporter-domain-containing protein n=2 Tax=Marchantia polymorpha TaxID=3197 RepID=A0AAF6ATZ8_MARPO|nr:hypothetical protein MARPO_0061s0040 [Marchantia polymorpha]BBM99918.1 hypothetical protein Mp_1g24820 [Marchantia polymorpha subsp. ruderalis]|eukprot:PTQ36766.1 hypothetical protein MARPO_0061s0040 [Marchantia polymorpha]